MTNPLLMAPYRATGNIVLRCKYNAGATMSVTLPLTQGRLYWPSGDGQADTSAYGGVGDLLGILDAALTSAFANVFTVSLTAAFKLNIAVSGGNTLQILWTDGATVLRGFDFGFDTSSDSADSVNLTSDWAPEGLFFPSRGFNWDTKDQKTSLGGETQAGDGTPFGIVLSDDRKDEREIGWDYLFKTLALKHYADSGSDKYNCIEDLWYYSLRHVRHLRVYPDDTALTSGDYSLYKNKFGKKPFTQLSGANQIYFDVRIPCVLIHEAV